jgi:hypothetical protein
MVLRLNEQLHYLYDSAGNLSYRTNNALIENFRGRISPLSRYQLPKMLSKPVLPARAPDFPPLFALGRFSRCDGTGDCL